MPPQPGFRLRFRLWHLFTSIAAASLAAWSLTQYGIVTAEIEIIDFDTWERTGERTQVSRDEPFELAKVVFQYVRPAELSNTRINLFLDSSTKAKTRIARGERFLFRYRALPLVWFKSTSPHPIAIARIGLDPDDVEETIVEIRLAAEQER